MGGNVFKNGSTERKSAASFNSIKADFTNALKAAFPYVHFEVLKAYGDKPDFGNLSVFVLSDGPDSVEKVVAFLRAFAIEGKVVRHGNRASIAYQGLQTDITFVPAANYRFALSYHAFNGLGGFLGRVADSLGLTLRDDGLVYKMKDGDQPVAEVPLAVTWQQALMLLGYSFTRWTEGFASLDEMFEFLASGEFFDASLFTDDIGKGQTAVQDTAQADGYRLTVVQHLAQFLRSASRPAREIPTKTLELLFDRIPGFVDYHAAVSSEWTAHKAQQNVISAKFNGNLVQAWTGRSGRALGELMQHITQTFGNKEDLGLWVLASTAENIQAMVREQHLQLSSQQQPA